MDEPEYEKEIQRRNRRSILHMRIYVKEREKKESLSADSSADQSDALTSDICHVRCLPETGALFVSCAVLSGLSSLHIHTIGSDRLRILESSLPVIDIRAEESTAIQSMFNGCSTTSFFSLRHHQMFHSGKDFVGLPLEVKRK